MRISHANRAIQKIKTFLVGASTYRPSTCEAEETGSLLLITSFSPMISEQWRDGFRRPRRSRYVLPMGSAKFESLMDFA